ncbi:MAG: hypothetical protein E6H53_10410 [Betaproteobacteria bacterium]|nr:MAG: hypothetical protein E6H53_10410 [Betaproteobacteria bacterium]
MIGVAGELQVSRTRRGITRDRLERIDHRRRPTLRFADRCDIFLDAVEQHPYFRHIPTEKPMDEVELLRRRQAIIGEMADIAPQSSARIGIGQAAGERHRARCERGEQLRARPTAADLAAGTRLKISVQHRARGRPEGRLRRKTVDDGHILEDETHAIAIALAMALAQHLRHSFRIGRRITGTNETSRDFAGRAPDRLRLQGVAAEQIDFLQLRKQSGTRVAARGAFQLVGGQRLACAQPVRIKLGAVVEMTGNEKNVTTHVLAAGRRQPVGAAALHQLDELKIVLGKAPAKGFLLVGRIDRDRADRLLIGVRIVGPGDGQQSSKQEELRGSRHGTSR